MVRNASRTVLEIVLLFVCLGLTTGCVTSEDRARPLPNLPPPRIERLQPSGTSAGRGFQLQPSGQSALAVLGVGFVRGSRVFFNGEPADTTFGSSRGLTALVPDWVYAEEGTVQVTVVNGNGQESDPFPFVVSPTQGQTSPGIRVKKEAGTDLQ